MMTSNSLCSATIRSSTHLTSKSHCPKSTMRAVFSLWHLRDKCLSILASNWWWIFFFGEMRSSNVQQCILWLEADRKIPEGLWSLGHAENVTSGISFPVFGHICGTKLSHESWECQGNDTITVNWKPFVDSIILQPRQYFTDLLIGRDLLALEVAFTSLLKSSHNSGSDVASKQHGYFWWSVLFNGCKFGRHCTCMACN